MYQSFINYIPVYCSAAGITDVVVSPGSRSAPLALAFKRFGKFTLRTVVDERSAAFIALGIAQQKRKPVVLICTSGTALLNYAPAIAEAFFQKIPLLVLTADRPPELVGNQDGQTIFQQQVFGKHVKAFYQLPDHYTENSGELNAAILQALEECARPDGGPVHVNVPLREPLYEQAPFVYPEISFQPPEKKVTVIDKQVLQQVMPPNGKILIAAAALPWTDERSKRVHQLIQKKKLVWLADLTSNLRNEATINAYDFLLGNCSGETKERLRPDVLITIGDNHVSKNLKLFLKTYKPHKHVHFSSGEQVPDTFNTQPVHVKAGVDTLLDLLEKNEDASDSDFFELWKQANDTATKKLASFIREVPFGELRAVHTLINEIPPPCLWQFANSMPVRYANYIPHFSEAKFFSNRGTSGIDGSVSTAVGAALTTTDPVFLLTGDLSFLYDEHALWNNFVPSNLRILVINNQGGGIFRLIEGPKDLPERDELFVTPHQRNIREVAHHYHLHYHRAANAYSLEGVLAQMFHPTDRAMVAEIVTDGETDSQVFQQFKSLKVF